MQTQNIDRADEPQVEEVTIFKCSICKWAGLEEDLRCNTALDVEEAIGCALSYYAYPECRTNKYLSYDTSF